MDNVQSMLRFSEKKGKGKKQLPVPADALAGAFTQYLRSKYDKEGGGAFDDFKKFVKKHKGKIGLAAGALGTAAALGLALHGKKPDTQRGNVHKIPPAIRDNPLGAILQQQVPQAVPIERSGRSGYEEEMKMERPETSLVRPHEPALFEPRPPALPPRRRRGTKVLPLASFLSGDGKKKKKKKTKEGKGAFMDFIKKHKKKLGIAAGVAGALGTAAIGAHLYNRKPSTPRIVPSSTIRHPSGFDIRNPAEEFYGYEDV